MEESSRSGPFEVMSHVLMVCSGGGHWIQMKRLLPAFDGIKISAATVDLACLSNAGVQFDYKIKIPDFNRSDPASALTFVFKSLWVIKKIKPTHVISTGAAPGVVMLAAARLSGAKVIWVDSIANTKKLSMSGRIACLFAHRVLTQWRHLDGLHGAKYMGRVI